MNRLQHEKSPYLQQHKNNPIDWFPWGEEAFKAAREANKPIFLSIGYATCHWCHVMEKESFIDPEVARALNSAFISIKVDREERPDIDEIYMEAIQAMSGQGGWPMSVLLTPEGQPFFGGTYFPRPHFLQILAKISEYWQKEPEQIKTQSQKLTDWLRSEKEKPLGDKLTNDVFKKFYQDFARRFDPENGAYRGQPKFPPSYALRLLLRIHRRTGDNHALHMVEKSLLEMAHGGIYDQIGGAFHRYATDAEWLVPHFEKMLYDQAALVNLYTEAFQATGKKEYKRIACETIDYVLRDLCSKEGAFYSAEDADSEGVEGKFYVWNYKELKEILSPEEFALLSDSYTVSESGNFEGDNILTWSKVGLPEEITPALQPLREKLLKIRAKRPRPLLDHKVITSWSALFTSAIVKAGFAFQEKNYIEAARMCADYLLRVNVDGNGRLLRRSVDGEAKHPAYLEDYAFLVDALLELYQATGEEKWISEALRYQKLQDEIFADPKGAYFNTRADDALLLQRKKETQDNVVPAGNSIAAWNLCRLAALGFMDPEKVATHFASLPESVRLAPGAYAQLLMVVDFVLDEGKEIVVLAKNLSEARAGAELFSGYFLPNKILVLSQGKSTAPIAAGKTLLDGKTSFYVCEKGACALPTTNHDAALASALKHTHYAL